MDFVNFNARTLNKSNLALKFLLLRRLNRTNGTSLRKRNVNEIRLFLTVWIACVTFHFCIFSPRNAENMQERWLYSSVLRGECFRFPDKRKCQSKANKCWRKQNSGAFLFHAGNFLCDCFFFALRMFLLLYCKRKQCKEKVTKPK